MQVFYLPKIWMLMLCILLWPLFQVSAALLCIKIPNRYLSPKIFLFRERKWERGGRFYEKVFRVRKWKHFLPDGGAVVKGGYKKKHLTDLSRENLERFITETCRAELSHILGIIPFWVFGLFAPRIIIMYMFLYAIAVNLPCIITQRYNRIRLVRVVRGAIK